MATHSKFIKDESLFKIESGKLIESDTLGTNVAAKMNRSTGDLEAINTDETQSALDSIGYHINDNGGLWWTNPNDQVFGTEKTGGYGNWGIYKQNNIYTTARQYAGKDNQYGMHIFRYPNVANGSTWGGLRLYPPADAKQRGHKYRMSFDYRGYSGGDWFDVYQNYEIGWGSMGIGLPGAWGYSVAPFDTDWEWNRYEYEFEIQDNLLDYVPGTDVNTGAVKNVWNANTQYGTGWFYVTYNGHVYRHRSGRPAPTLGVDPETEYTNLGASTGPWDWKVPMVAGYLDIYRQIKIGFNYQAQNQRGSHVYIDNIQLTDITTNQRWKFNGNGWEADNLSEGTTHIFAKGTAYVGLNKGDGGDIFAVEGNRVLEVNGTQIYNTGGRGLRLTIIDEATKNIDSDTLYDVHGSTAARDSLATALSGIASTKLWVLTSFDAVGSTPGTALNNQMKAMGSVMYQDDGNEYSLFDGTNVRNPYAAVGRGQQIIKEDGSAQLDNVYKRKGVIDLRV